MELPRFEFIEPTRPKSSKFRRGSIRTMESQDGTAETKYGGNYSSQTTKDPSKESGRGGQRRESWMQRHKSQLYGLKVSKKGEKKPDLNTKHLLTGFLEKTTSHGVSHIFQAKGYLKKLTWVVLSFSVVGLLVFHNWWLFDNYFSYNTSSSTDVVTDRKLVFPAVTICNNNAIRKSVQSDVLGTTVAKMTTVEGGTSVSPEQTTGLFQDLVAELAALDPDTRLHAGHQLESMVVYCTFNRAACNLTTDFTASYNPVYGNCYTFNLGLNGTRKDTEKAGPYYGLSLSLFIQESQYIKFLTPSAGLTIQVHDQDVMPFPQEMGFMVAPNGQYNVAIQETRITREAYPYSSCTVDEMADYNLYAGEYKVKYSLAACIKTCFQKLVEARCTCYDPEVPSSRGLNQEPCPFANDTSYDCWLEVKQLFAENKLKCARCEIPCSEKKFSESVSQSVWPAKTYMSVFARGFNFTHPDVVTAEMSSRTGQTLESLIEHNFLQVNVFYKELEYMTIVQEAQYTVYQFISDVGGCFGLWIGWSIMTMFELVELFSDLLAFRCIKKADKKEADSNQVESTND